MNPKPHDILTCPYNKAHQVERYRMHIHLEKCKKQYAGKLETCAFDCTHVVRDAELDHHVEKCSKRIMFDEQKYVTDDDHRPVTNVLPTHTDTTSAENWDDECVESYNPAEAKKNAAIIPKWVKGATKSQRNAARMEGRLRYQAALQNQAQDQ